MVHLFLSNVFVFVNVGVITGLFSLIYKTGFENQTSYKDYF